MKRRRSARAATHGAREYDRVENFALGHWSAWLLLALGFWISGTAFAEKLVIVYPRPISGTNSGYPVAVLDLALSKSGLPYELQPSEMTMQQNRALAQLAQHIEINVVWSMTSKEREKDLLPIRIPIDKGLLGWRIFFIDRKDQKRFDDIKNLEQLKSLSAGQEHDWPDVDILTANGLPVNKGSNYAGLFSMLERGRFDYLPRSIQEIWDEEQQHRDSNIMVEQTIALHYPAAEYFFVNKSDKVLADALENGLRTSIKDGSFERLFTMYNGKSLARANIKKRKVFNLVNPLSPHETPLEKKELWIER